MQRSKTFLYPKPLLMPRPAIPVSKQLVPRPAIPISKQPMPRPAIPISKKPVASISLNVNSTKSRSKSKAKAVIRPSRGTSTQLSAQPMKRAVRKTKAAVRSPLRSVKLSRPIRTPKLKQGPRPLRQRRVSLANGRVLPSSKASSAAFRSGVRAGMEDAARISLDHEPYQKKALNRYWMERDEARQWAGTSWRQYNEAAKGYVSGFFQKKKQHVQDWVLLPTIRSVAVIVSVMNEEDTIGPIMHQLNRLPLDEVLVLVNGSADRSFENIRKCSHAVLLSLPEPLGHDVGRAMGAKLAGSDILLFLDGDIVLSAEELLSFIGGVDQGLDVALNDITPYLEEFAKRDSVTRMKQFLNVCLGRNDLEANSLTAVPHAMSRKALESIGITTLMVPPKAQALAIHNGLRVEASGCVDVIRNNKRRKHNTGPINQVADLIIGDHLEALKLVGDLAGDRLSFVDGMRQRDQAGGIG
jgi:hypothetical protein